MYISSLLLLQIGLFQLKFSGLGYSDFISLMFFGLIRSATSLCFILPMFSNLSMVFQLRICFPSLPHIQGQRYSILLFPGFFLFQYVCQILPLLIYTVNGWGLLDQNRILGEIEEQIEQILAMVFENYKSLDESSPSGIVDVFRPATGSPAPALLPSIKLYSLLHDVLSPEAQLKLCSYFQV